MSTALDFVGGGAHKAPAAHYAECPATEWAARVDLAAVFVAVVLFGWSNLIFTHLSATVPGTDGNYLLNPLHLMFEEMTASDLVKIDRAGTMGDPGAAMVNRSGISIHGPIHASRPRDCAVVMHVLSHDGQAVATQKHGLLPLSQVAMHILADVAYHDFGGIAIEGDECAALLEDLGTRSFLVLRNHGTLSAGPTVAEAFLRLYMYERACTAQGAELNWPSAAALEQVARVRPEGVGSDSFASVAEIAWRAVRRKLDCLIPGYDS